MAPRLVVLMATFNGGRFISEQLGSLAGQSVAQLDVLVSDDGSTDDTLAKVELSRGQWKKGRFDIVSGPRTGSHADNFRHLFLMLEDTPVVALSDQDDVWMPHKLANAIKALSVVPTDIPAVYCSRTTLIGAGGTMAGHSPHFGRPASFRNAVVQSLAGGNTMVLNPAAVRLVQRSFHRVRVPAHDWWIYMLVTGAGGRMIYSASPDTFYRQHSNNVVGSGSGWRARLRRLGSLLHGQFRRWSDANEAALLRCSEMLTADALRTLQEFMRMRRSPLLSPLLLWRSRIYRQTAGGHAMLYIAMLFGLA